MPKIARKITLVPLDGSTAPRVLFSKPDKSKRGSPWLRPLEKIEHRLLLANQAGAEELLRRHERSNDRKRDGWITNAGTNVYKAAREAYRTYRKLAPQILPK